MVKSTSSRGAFLCAAEKFLDWEAAMDSSLLLMLIVVLAPVQSNRMNKSQ